MKGTTGAITGSVIVVLALAGVLGFLVLEEDTTTAWGIYSAVAVGSMIAFVLGMGATARLGDGAWWLILGYLAVTVTSDVIGHWSAPRNVRGMPQPADIGYLVAYGLAFAALVVFRRRVDPSHQREAWIDTGIIALAATSLVTLVVVEPMATQGVEDTWAAVLLVAYPAIDLALLACFGRQLLDPIHLRGPLVVIGISFAIVFVVDLLDAIEGNLGLPADPAIGAGYLASYALLAVAAWMRRPSAAEQSERGTSGDRRRWAVAAAAVVVPTVLVVVAAAGMEEFARIMALSTVATITLLLVRFRLLFTVAQRQAAGLSELARTDPLTSLPNRRTLEFELDRIDRDPCDGRYVAMFDIDHFKDYNDSHGHQAGDEALRACAAAWRAALPRSDLLARYGGEEFVAVLSHRDDDSARRLLDAVRAATPPPLTVSIGCAPLLPGRSARAAVAEADTALYDAKTAGRNRVHLAEPHAPAMAAE